MHVELGARVTVDRTAGPARRTRPGGRPDHRPVHRDAAQPPGEVFAAAARCAPGSARRSPVRRPTRGRWCRPWSSVTTSRCPSRSSTDFRTCGLTHLAAVSGTNLTLVVGFLLLVARWAGCAGPGTDGGRACIGVAGFVLLARPEPSVLRAAAMGSVALLGHRGSRGAGQRGPCARRRGPGAAARRPVAGAVPRVRALVAGHGRHLVPRPAVPRRAAAPGCPGGRPRRVAVPFAAQLACTPVVAAVSEQVSLVAVPANLLVAAVVGARDGARSAGWVLMLAGARGRARLRLARRAVRLVDHHRRHPPRAAAERRAGLVTRAGVPSLVLGVLCLVVGLGRRPGAAPAALVGPALRRARRRDAATAADARLAASGLGDGRVRRRPGRRPGAQRRRRPRGRRRHRPGPAARWTRCLGRLGVRTRCRSSCSRTSTPTTSTACGRCSTAIAPVRWT